MLENCSDCEFCPKLAKLCYNSDFAFNYDDYFSFNLNNVNIMWMSLFLKQKINNNHFIILAIK